MIVEIDLLEADFGVLAGSEMTLSRGQKLADFRALCRRFELAQSALAGADHEGLQASSRTRCRGEFLVGGHCR